MNVSETWSMPADHPALPGHFPGQPIVPGVVLLAEAVRLARARLGLAEGALSWQRVKFLAPVRPEQRVQFELEGDANRFTFTITDADGQPIARGQARHEPLA
ncbi:MaoC/PaaZ C-terminal domain-containing protein [Wenzhouxiangella marina]|uniref:3-hydroxymyristoyl/3-hydroxydecanoyl-(Acyl carrier protein) dehydratase n=1 Tax=Wenzhouxiangella marina TaxID=1579979 RepID=A0A0K0Y0E9_9GAMM|nr:MaoC/PaaZ C-terminal domain-containing protein [Wenzhouxiangella marina]AKS43362.1 3-hydroxymyristoyl/3-hydroxydecanoyl-(Acyl carrier protein) dehydratase [Wenzhouxiangella marina]MBB6088523.1 3-hydroxymyristoyl/3-hydroxydecanoyl-(acyl carrier protein) dehydratase [Wenzhouxiangella marina]